MSENLNTDSSREANEEAQKWESLTRLEFNPKEASRVEVKSAGNAFGESDIVTIGDKDEKEKVLKLLIEKSKSNNSQK